MRSGGAVRRWGARAAEPVRERQTGEDKRCEHGARGVEENPRGSCLPLGGHLRQGGRKLLLNILVRNESACSTQLIGTQRAAQQNRERCMAVLVMARGAVRAAKAAAAA